MGNEKLAEFEEKLKGLLSGMDIPSHRKFMNTIHNYKWLYKNLAARNKDNPLFSKAMGVLEILVKEKK